MTLATTQLEDTIGAEMERSGLTGLAIALIKQGDIVWSNAYGTANVDTGEVLTTEMPFSIMSVTKTMISTALMQLRDEGHFQLDDPANQYLAPTRISNDFEAESPVTIRQLMTHTSGLPVLSVEGRPGKISLDEYVNQFARTTHRPGTEIVYANSAFVAMGVLIERFSGMGVDEYLRARIFEPLGMASARLANPEHGDEHATGHYRSFVDGKVRTLPLPEWSTIPNSPAGGVWSTVEDVAKFVAAHLSNGGPILSRETTAEMHDLHVRQGSSPSGQGLGWRVTRSNGHKLICHGGDGGGFTAFAGAYPEAGVGVVLLINTGAMQIARAVIGNTALEAVLGNERKSLAVTQPLPQGTYKSTFWDIVVEAREDALVATEGLVLLGETDETTIDDGNEAHGGILHGFEVTTEGDRFFGGVYPFTFVRTGDLPSPQRIDEQADLTGTWRGTSTTPMGPLAVTITLASETAGTIDTPFAQGLALSDCVAEKGRLAGEFAMQVPGVGNTQMFLRLECRSGRLIGKTHARSDFGEIAMQTDLERA